MEPSCVWGTSPQTDDAFALPCAASSHALGDVLVTGLQLSTERGDGVSANQCTETETC